MAPLPELIPRSKLKRQKRNIPSTKSNSRISVCLMPGRFSADWGPEFKGAIISAYRGHREASGIAKKMLFGAIAARPAKICAMMPRNSRRPLFCAAARVQCPKISVRICVAEKRTAARRPLFPEEIVIESFSRQCPRAILNANSSISPRVRPMSSSS